MANRILQGIMEKMSKAYPCEIGILDDTGYIIASSNYDKVDTQILFRPSFNSEPFVENNTTYALVNDNQVPYLFAYVKSTDKNSSMLALILANSIQNIRQYADDKLNLSNFIKNVVMDNILPGDIFVKSRELNFDTELDRICMVVRSSDNSSGAIYDIVSPLFPEKQKDFVFTINQKDFVIVKQLDEGEKNDEIIEELANTIISALPVEDFGKVLVGIGSVANGVRELARSCKEAQVSLEICKVFDEEKSVIKYDSLGIARLIYQLPTTLCDMYMKEVFKDGSMTSLDKETIFTIQKFFENNLNVSETSRKLFVHRNTLVYRLEKIKKLTGLDLREFDNAIVFKVAMMVDKYLAANPVKY